MIFSLDVAKQYDVQAEGHSGNCGVPDGYNWALYTTTTLNEEYNTNHSSTEGVMPNHSLRQHPRTAIVTEEGQGLAGYRWCGPVLPRPEN